MDEQDLIYDWNKIDYEIERDGSNHPHELWFDDETLRDGLQSPSARNPTIEQKIELIDFMEVPRNPESGSRTSWCWPLPRWSH